jgi:hypothetical protein
MSLSNFEVGALIGGSNLVVKINAKVDRKFYHNNLLPDMTISLFTLIVTNLVSLPFQKYYCMLLL